MKKNGPGSKGYRSTTTSRRSLLKSRSRLGTFVILIAILAVVGWTISSAAKSSGLNSRDPQKAQVRKTQEKTQKRQSHKNKPKLTTDKENYEAGEAITVTGKNWSPGEAVNVFLNLGPATAGQTVKATADQDGAFSARLEMPVARNAAGQKLIIQRPNGAAYKLTATGQTSGASAQAQVQNGEEGDTDDPDLPWWQQGKVDGGELIRLRDEYVAMIRGNQPGLPIDPASRGRAIELMDQQEAASPQGKVARSRYLAATGKSVDDPLLPFAFPQWVELGPNPIPLGQTSGGRTNVSGRVTAIEIDPTNPNLVYVGTAQGGVYRTTDGGANWTPIFDGAQTLAVGSLSLDPVHNWLWVGTGEANGSADSFAGVGLYRIENASTSADLVGPINPIRNYVDGNGNPASAGFFSGRSISKIVRVPGDPNTMFVGVAGGVIGIGGQPPLGNALPPLAMRGLVRLSNVTGPIAGITGTRLAVSTNPLGGIAGGLCFDTPCTVNRSANDLVLDPQDPSGNTLIVWLNGTNVAGDGGIYRSTDAMSPNPTFTQTLITTSTTTSNGRGELRAYVRSGTTVVYVASGEPSNNTGTGGATLCNSSTNFGALRRSTDGGATWSNKLSGGGGFCAGQCFYNIGFDVLPGAATTTDKLLLGGNVTSGQCARQQSTSLDGATTAFVAHDSQTHADTHYIKMAPSDSNIVYRGDDGGIWKSTDGGNTFVNLNNTTFRATQFQSIAVHPTDPNISLGGTQDNGTEKMVTGPIWSHSDDGDGGYAMIDQSTPTTYYHTYFNQAASQIGYARSTNSGTSWTFLGCSGTGTTNGISCASTVAVNFYAPTALGPGSPNNTVYIGTDRLLRSSTQGTANVAVSQVPLVSGVAISAIGISPQDDNYRFVGNNNGALWYTATGSSTLTSLDPVGGGSVIPDAYVARLVFDPANKNTAYISLGAYFGGTGPAQSHVWKITNLNTTPVKTAINGSGANVLPDVPVNGFAVDTNDIAYPGVSVLYAGTDIGVYKSVDGGLNWTPFGIGLPRVAVFDMAIVNSKRVLRIATHGRGMWEINLNSYVPTSLSVDPASGTYGGTVNLSATLTSNSDPVSDKTINFTLNGNSVGSATTNASGVATLMNASLAGINVGTYPNGVGASFAGDNDFAPANATNSLTVSKATPVITWANPADITYGTPLSSTQLNATANTPGTFTYTPPAGTVLPVGNGQTLHVDFTPTDTTNYNNASKDVTINVLPASFNVTMTASRNPAPVDFNFNYNIAVNNPGGAAATGTVLTDVLPSQVSFTAVSSSQGTCSYASATRTVSCSLGTIGAGATINVQITVKPREEGTLDNTVSASATNYNTSTASVNGLQAQKQVDVSISKTDSVDPITVGDQETYTLTIKTASGPTNATGVVATDNLPASMTFVSATTSQGALVTPSIGSTGIVTANIGTMAPSSTVTVTITVTSTQAGAITNTATVSSTEADSTPANNTSSQTTTVKAPPPPVTLQKVLLGTQTLTGGCGNTTGNVYLTAPAPAGGVTVNLSSNVSGASVPATVTIAAGQMVSPDFAVTSSPVPAKQTGLITATLGAQSVSRSITINKGNGTCP